MRSGFVPVAFFSLWMASVSLITLQSHAHPFQDTGETQTASDFVSLFNGENLDGWYAIKTYDPRSVASLTEEAWKKRIEGTKAETEKYWRVENGEIVNDGEGPYLTTRNTYRDFELHIDYKTVAKADSGIYLKATPQVQIWDTTQEGGKWNIGADKGSGGLWNNSAGAPGKDPLVLADKPFGEWNQVRILQVGSRTSVWLNDQLVVDHAIMENYWKRELPLINEGPIQLQTHGGEIRWRNIKIRELSTEEANLILMKKGHEGFTSVFNGQDFSGWKGPTSNYEIENGNLRCKKGAGGTIYTEKKYQDFVARLQFKLPPGGNNGLAIRYPGSGDTAYVGMCELQVLDNTHPKFANLDKTTVPRFRLRHGTCPSRIFERPGRVEFSGGHGARFKNQS